MAAAGWGNVLQALAVLADYYALVKRYLLKMSLSLIGLIAAVLPFLGFLNFLGGLFILALLVGCFLVLGPQRQALHDMLADTAVYPDSRSFAGVIMPPENSGAVGAAPPPTREPAPVTAVAPPPPPPV